MFESLLPHTRDMLKVLSALALIGLAAAPAGDGYYPHIFEFGGADPVPAVNDTPTDLPGVETEWREHHLGSFAVPPIPVTGQGQAHDLLVEVEFALDFEVGAVNGTGKPYPGWHRCECWDPWGGGLDYKVVFLPSRRAPSEQGHPGDHSILGFNAGRIVDQFASLEAGPATAGPISIEELEADPNAWSIVGPASAPWWPPAPTSYSYTDDGWTWGDDLEEGEVVHAFVLTRWRIDAANPTTAVFPSTPGQHVTWDLFVDGTVTLTWLPLE